MEDYIRDDVREALRATMASLDRLKNAGASTNTSRSTAQTVSSHHMNDSGAHMAQLPPRDAARNERQLVANDHGRRSHHHRHADDSPTSEESDSVHYKDKRRSGKDVKNRASSQYVDEAVRYSSRATAESRLWLDNKLKASSSSSHRQRNTENRAMQVRPSERSPYMSDFARRFAPSFEELAAIANPPSPPKPSDRLPRDARRSALEKRAQGGRGGGLEAKVSSSAGMVGKSRKRAVDPSPSPSSVSESMDEEGYTPRAGEYMQTRTYQHYHQQREHNQHRQQHRPNNATGGSKHGGRRAVIDRDAGVYDSSSEDRDSFDNDDVQGKRTGPQRQPHQLKQKQRHTRSSEGENEEGSATDEGDSFAADDMRHQPLTKPAAVVPATTPSLAAVSNNASIMAAAQEEVGAPLRAALEEKAAIMREMTGTINQLKAEVSNAKISLSEKDLDFETRLSALKVAHHKEMGLLLEREAHQRRRSIEEVSETLKRSHEEEMKKVEDELEKARGQLGDVTRRFAAFKRDHGSLKEKNADVQASLSKRIEELAAKTKRVDDLTRTVKDQRDAALVLQQKAATAENERKAMEDRLRDAREALLRSEEKLKQAELANSRFEDHAKSELERLTKLFEENRQAHEQKFLESDKIGAKYDRLKVKAKHLQDTVNRLETELEGERGLASHLRDEVAKTQNELAHQVNDRLARERAIEERLESISEQYSEEKEGLERTIQQLKTNGERLDVALQHSRKEASEEADARRALEAEIADAKAELERTTSHYKATLRRAEEDYRSLEGRSEETIAALKRNLDEKNRQLEQLMSVSAKSTDSVSKLRDQLASERGKNASLENQLAEVRGLAQHVARNLQREMRRSEIKNLPLHGATTAAPSPSTSRVVVHQSGGSAPSESNASSALAAAVRTLERGVAVGSSPSTQPPRHTSHPSINPTPVAKRVVIHEPAPTSPPLAPLEQVVARAAPPTATVNTSGSSTSLVDRAYESRMTEFSNNTHALFQKLASDEDFRAQCTAAVRNLDYIGTATAHEMATHEASHTASRHQTVAVSVKRSVTVGDDFTSTSSSTSGGDD